MSFPSNPTNGQQANINGITYTYSTSLTSWNVSTSVSNSFVSLSATGNVTSGNVISVGIVSATGNITGSYILGNGSQLTGVATSYGNANVAANLAAFGSNPISTTGNITAGYFIGNGVALTSITGANVTGTVANATYATSAGSSTTAGTVTTAAQTNITSVGTLSSLSVTGNVTGNYILGNGSQLTGLPATYGNANVAANLAAFGSNPISTTGNITGGNLTTSGTMTAATVTETSSIALKENFRPIEDPLEKVLQLLGQIYDRKDGSSRDEAGLVAEEVYKIIPNLVKTDANGNPQSVFYSRLSVYLLEALKVLHDEVKQLKAGK